MLRNKLPEELRPLCVSRTDDGVLGQQELESSINGILTRHGTYDPVHSAGEIKRLADRLREARIQQSEALLELRTVREMDTFVYSADIGDYTGTPCGSPNGYGARRRSSAGSGPCRSRRSTPPAPPGPPGPLKPSGQ